MDAGAIAGGRKRFGEMKRLDFTGGKDSPIVCNAITGDAGHGAVRSHGAQSWPINESAVAERTQRKKKSTCVPGAKSSKRKSEFPCDTRTHKVFPQF